MFLWNLAVFGLARGKCRSDLLEGVVEFGIVQEHPVVVELAIEAIFDLSDGTSNFPVSSESVLCVLWTLAAVRC